MSSRTWIALGLCTLLTTPSFADFRYDETTQITGGTIVSMMKFVGVFSKDAKKTMDPITSTVLVQGNRMARINPDQTELIDLDKETITTIDHKKKQYTVMTFEQMKQQMEEATKKAKEQQAKAKPSETVRCGNEETGEGGFRLIENEQLHLIIEYGTAGQCQGLQEAVSAIKAKVAADEVPLRWATRRLQNFVVSVFPKVFEKLDRAFPLAIEHLFLNYYTWKGDYSEQTGLGDVIESLSGRDEE